MIEGDIPQTGRVKLVAPHQENGCNHEDLDTITEYFRSFSTVIARLNRVPVQCYDEKLSPPDQEQIVDIEMTPEAKKIIQEAQMRFRLVV